MPSKQSGVWLASTTAQAQCSSCWTGPPQRWQYQGGGEASDSVDNIPGSEKYLELRNLNSTDFVIYNTVYLDWGPYIWVHHDNLKNRKMQPVVYSNF